MLINSMSAECWQNANRFRLVRALCSTVHLTACVQALQLKDFTEKIQAMDK
jgi:hypothetical protein